MDIPKSLLKNRLKEAMCFRDKKAADLAKDLGIPKSAISQYLSGKSQNMDSSRLYAISMYLDVDPVWLMGYDVPIKRVDLQYGGNNMEHDENKKIMADNIQRYMDQRGITRHQLCDALDIKYTTLRDWLKGLTYPRIGKVEAMANYFGCEKSDLIEQKTDDSVRDVQITERELRIIQAVRRMSEEQKQAFETLLGTQQQ